MVVRAVSTSAGKGPEEGLVGTGRSEEVTSELGNDNCRFFKPSPCGGCGAELLPLHLASAYQVSAISTFYS